MQGEKFLNRNGCEGERRMRKGILGGQYKPLSDVDIKKIHQASMKVFEVSGIEVNDQRALQFFKDGGADVDFSKKRVRADEKWVMNLVSKAPKQIVLCGRDEKNDLVLGGKKVHLGTGGTALNILDVQTGTRRPTMLKDLCDAAKVVDALENIHYFILSCYPNDIDKPNVDVNRFFAGIKNTSKHVMGGVYTKDGVQNVIRMAEIIAGGAEALRRRPFISMICCIMSPLVMDKTYTELMLEVIEAGIPLATPAAPMAGATSPGTLAGTLVQLNVEALSGIVLAQLANPGTPVLYSAVPTTVDLRTGAFCFGGIEMGIMNAASAQLAQLYDLPNYTTAGVSDAKIPDIQSGFESASTTVLAALAGSNYIHDAAGLLESGLSIALEQYVIDDDILGMVMRAVQGIEVNEDTLAVEVINNVGPAGNYITHDHTYEYMRKEFFYPKAADRQTRDRWTQDGAFDTREKARRMALKILAEHQPMSIDTAIEAQLYKVIPGLK
jgi:trimethylamine---corrinoid protein Co-methyltransferase